MKRRLLLFAGLDLLQGALVGGFPLLLPSTSAAADALLLALGGAMILAAPALVFGGRPGRWYAAAACLAHLVAGAVLAVLVASAAAYLSGIYGAFGRTLAAFAAAIGALVLVVFWLLPAHELAWLRGRDR